MYYVQNYNNPEDAANILSFLVSQSLNLIDTLTTNFQGFINYFEDAY